MAMPFDTLKLARRLEAAGFPAQEAGDMVEAIAEAVSQLATKAGPPTRRGPAAKPQRVGGEDVAIMHYREVFNVREIAYATAENAEHLGINPGQMFS
jgi:hypothetical protein